MTEIERVVRGPKHTYCYFLLTQRYFISVFSCDSSSIHDNVNRSVGVSVGLLVGRSATSFKVVNVMNARRVMFLTSFMSLMMLTTLSMLTK